MLLDPYGLASVAADRRTSSIHRPNGDGRSFVFELGGARKEIANGSKILFINGVDTSFSECYKHAEYLSNLCGGVNVCGLYNPTYGKFWDYLKTAETMGIPGPKTTFKMTDPALVGYDFIMDFFEINRYTSAKLCVFPHSGGSSEFSGTLSMLRPTVANRIKVINISPSTFISNDSCEKAINYVNGCDFVPMLSRILDYANNSLQNMENFKNITIGRDNFQECQENIQYLPSLEGFFSFLDHGFQSKTFRDSIKEEGKEFINENGGLR
jgi:hypothetical protein